MITHNICEICDKKVVCKIEEILYKFSEENKKQLGVDITINHCENYKEDENREDE